MSYYDEIGEPSMPPPPPVVAIAAWLVPGLGYVLIGERRRALFAGITIFIVFLLGLLIAGVRCVDVPGFDVDGTLKRQGSQTILTNQPIRAIADKPWYIPQILAGPLTIATSIWSVEISGSVDKSTARLWDIGTLYTAVAGMLNLLVIIDAAHRAALIREANPRLGPM